MAFYDPLTKLPNRRLLTERLNHSMMVNERSGQHGALLYFDLDHFKTINDAHGHKTGDQLLIEVAKRLKSCLRDVDNLARVGGDEFVVTLETLGSQSRHAANKVEQVAELIREQLNQPYEIEGARYFTSPSVGVVIFQGLTETTDDLLKHAETAMYGAKSTDRNSISFYDPSIQKEVEQRATLETQLHEAIEQNQLELYYQLQVDEHKNPIGAEALIRWHHPQRGQVSPADFIPLAEETGQIKAMGRWVIEKACEQLRDWQNQAHLSNLILAINVSAKQFKEPNFVDQVSQNIQRYGIHAGRLKIELTESTIIDNIEETVLKMRQLRELGVKFSLDDFGTGYSSLQYLKRLPLDQIKIDQTFVRDIVQDPDDVTIVKTIIAMSQSLGLDVIAEGVETQEQRDILLANGCHHYQGYFFGRPCPVEQFSADLVGRLAV
ncbi:diguanylate cyclase [Thiomicrospira aerophila AL3]|uniref:cyclic-guanylate-specific phosphodiesterase n=1 Tax=Thiomicrospira aerophila AL3 TaxID=717772 RepID=W0DXL1_9GAMM|nr:diguanylate cyclase [Thiomicrospira aerophila AL3]